MSKCLVSRKYNNGDKNKKYTNNDFRIHLCHTCDNRSDFSKVEVPYAYKLLSQELQTINIVPRIITQRK